MKKTAMQELFQFMEQSQYFIGNDLYNKYQELLEKEKQQIVEANIAGMEFIAVDPNRIKTDAEEYFNETYGK